MIEASLRIILEAIPGVVYAKDRQGRMLVANRGTAQLIGKKPSEFLGKTDAEFLEDKDDAAVVMATDQRIMSSGIAEQIEEHVRLADGTPAIWLSTKAPLRDEAGTVVGLVGTSVDVTERKRLEARRLALVELADRLRELDDPSDLAYAAAEILGRALAVRRAGFGPFDVVSEDRLGVARLVRARRAAPGRPGAATRLRHLRRGTAAWRDRRRRRRGPRRQNGRGPGAARGRRAGLP